MNQNLSSNYKMNRDSMKKDWLICLNPQCKNEDKILKINGNQTSSIEHRNCKPWVKKLSELSFSQQAFSCHLQTFSLDYLQQPINSIFAINCLQLSEFQSFKNVCYNKILSSISLKVKAMLNHHFNGIKDHLDLNKSILQKIKNYQFFIRHSDKEKALQYYDKNLKEDLFKVYQMGKITVINEKSLESHLQIINKELQSLSCHLWIQQSNQCIEKRLATIHATKKIESLLDENDSDAISRSIQFINSGLKLGQQKLLSEPKGASVFLFCEICQQKIETSQGNKQQKRNECQKQYLHHLCKDHRKVIQKIMIQKNKQSYKMTFQTFLQDIRLNSHKKFIIIDRENMNTSKFIENLSDQYYCLQIVGRNTQNLASGRYIVADSTGKDAADILIIIALYEISKLTKKEIVLLTNDHYGNTMQPIFKGFGAQITIEKGIFSETAYNYPTQSLRISNRPTPPVQKLFNFKKEIKYMQIQ